MTASGAHLALYVRTALDPGPRTRMDAEMRAMPRSRPMPRTSPAWGMSVDETVLDAGIHPLAERLDDYRDAVDEVVLRAITPADGVDDYLRFLESAEHSSEPPQPSTSNQKSARSASPRSNATCQHPGSSNVNPIPHSAPGRSKLLPPWGSGPQSGGRSEPSGATMCTASGAGSRHPHHHLHALVARDDRIGIWTEHQTVARSRRPTPSPEPPPRGWATVAGIPARRARRDSVRPPAIRPTTHPTSSMRRPTVSARTRPGQPPRQRQHPRNEESKAGQSFRVQHVISLAQHGSRAPAIPSRRQGRDSSCSSSASAASCGVSRVEQPLRLQTIGCRDHERGDRPRDRGRRGCGPALWLAAHPVGEIRRGRGRSARSRTRARRDAPPRAPRPPASSRAARDRRPRG